MSNGFATLPLHKYCMDSMLLFSRAVNALREISWHREQKPGENIEF